MTGRIAALSLGLALTLFAWSAGAARAGEGEQGDMTGAGAQRGPAIGAEAPDFTLPAVAGGEVTLSDLRGAPVVLIFFRGAW